jgi:hypothetical protein
MIKHGETEVPNHHLSLDPKFECVRAGHHSWDSIAGGYWCHICHLIVTDATITKMRQTVSMPLDKMLEFAAKDSALWVAQLHYWTQNSDI